MKLCDLRIIHKLVLVLAFPVLGLLGYATYDLIRIGQTVNDTQRVVSLAQTVPQITKAVRALQDERSAAVNALANMSAEETASILAPTYSATDTSLRVLNTALTELNALTDSDDMREIVSDVQVQLSGLSDVRRLVEQDKLTFGQASGRYTQMISPLIEVNGHLASLSTRVQIGRMITAYLGLQQLNERAQLELAAGSDGFTRGEFPQPLHTRLIGLMSEQDAFLLLFRAYALPEQIALYNDTVKGPALDNLDYYRYLAILAPHAGNTGGISGTDWRDAMSEKIALTEQVEDRVIADIGLTAGDILGQARLNQLVIIGVTAILLGLAIPTIYVVGRGITLPLRDATTAMDALAGGDLNTNIPTAGRRDEIGGILRALLVFRDNARKIAELQTEQTRLHAEQTKMVAQREEERERLAREFEASVGSALHAVTRSSDELREFAANMLDVARQSSNSVDTVANLTHQSTENVQTVASASEDLSGSINDIAERVRESSKLTEQAVRSAEQTDETVTSLSDAGDKIGSVVALISDVAEKTNLLALNASIEAARAGEAGKGFAVVAAEVLNLAGQTSRATDEISAQVGSMTGATHEAVSALQAISDKIAGINSLSEEIARAVDQQQTATDKIASSMQTASEGNTRVSRNIEEVRSGVDDSASTADKVFAAAEGLHKLADSLTNEIATFVAKIRHG